MRAALPLLVVALFAPLTLADDRTDWLKKNAVPLSTLDPTQEKDGSLKREAKYAKTVTFGDEVCKAMGADVYSVAFTAAEGEWKLMQNREGVKLADPRGGSLEDLMCKAGLTNAFLDLKAPAAGGKWLGKRRWVMRPMGYADMEAIWPRSFDGVVFTKTMIPSDSVAVDDPCK